MAEFKTIKGRTGLLRLRCNCLPVYELDKKEWVLMDSGSAWDREELKDFLEEAGIQVRAVLTSHAHFDHVGNHRFLQEKYGARLWMAALDAGMTRDYTALKACFYSLPAGQIRRMYPEMQVSADEILLPGQDRVSVLGEAFEIIELPGHSAVHLGFSTPDGIWYLGDAFQGEKERAGEKLFYMLCWKEALETVEGLWRQGPAQCILSHGGWVLDTAAEAQGALRDYRDRLRRFEALAGDGSSLEEITAAVAAGFGVRTRTERKARLMERIVRAMVEYLTETGRYEAFPDGGVIRYRKMKIETGEMRYENFGMRETGSGYNGNQD